MGMGAKEVAKEAEKAEKLRIVTEKQVAMKTVDDEREAEIKDEQRQLKAKPPAELVDDRAFVTFRYSSDQMAAIEAFKRRPVKKKMERMMRRARTWFRLPDGDGEARRAGAQRAHARRGRGAQRDRVRCERLVDVDGHSLERSVRNYGERAAARGHGDAQPGS